MIGYASWILQASPREKNWLNSNADGKEEVVILLANRFVKLVRDHRNLHDNRVVHILKYKA